MQQTCIVTGGSGFLGKHLCRALTQAGHIVKNIDLRPNDEVETIRADIRDAAAMQQHIQQADVVFHLAALIEAGESVKRPADFIESNILGSLNILSAMAQNSVPTMIFSSSAAVYGNPIRVPIQENDRTLPISPYGMTKLAMEGLISSFTATHGLTGIALRYFNLYGPEEQHQPETHAIPRFIKQITAGEPVTVWGDGGHLRDYVYISDIVTAHVQALEYASAHPGQYEYFNLSTETPASVFDIVHHLESLMGKTAQIAHHPDRPGDPRELWASAAKAHELLGWQSQVQLEEGLRQTVEYFAKHPEPRI